MIADASSVSGYGIIGLQVDVPNQKIYWFDDGAKTIERANFDGTGRETFVANPGYSYTIIIDHQNQQVY